MPFQVRQGDNPVALRLMGRALPGTRFPEGLPHGIREQMAHDVYAYELDMTPTVPDSTVDIEVTMSAWSGPRRFDVPGPEPEFGDVRATRDALDNRGLHLKTLYWDGGGVSGSPLSLALKRTKVYKGRGLSGVCGIPLEHNRESQP